MPENNTIKVDTLLHAKWLIPAVPADCVLSDHSLALLNGRIVAIGPRTELQVLYRADREFLLEDHALIPGLINSHGHAAMTLFRGYADDLPLQRWLQDHIWPAESQWISREFVRDGAKLAIAEMLQSGTTCFADNYFFPDAVAAAATEAGMRAQLACPVMEFPTAWGDDAEDYIYKATRLRDDYRNSELISIAFGPHAPYTVADASLRKISTLAAEMELPVHMHIHETAQEVSDAVSESGKRPLERLAEIGLITPRLACVHATQLTEDDVNLLADNGASVVHCPESNLKLASGFCPVQKLFDAGINVALGTDGAASNNDLDMFSEMRTAALLAKGVAEDAAAVPASRALQMATINGARALGLEQVTGSLEVGKLADVVAVRLNSLTSTPMYNPLSQLVYSSSANQVSHVWIGGRLVVKNARLTTADVDSIKARAHDWRTRIQPDSTNGVESADSQSASITSSQV